MKITGVLLAVAVAGLYGCSDKDDTNSGEQHTSLIEKANLTRGEPADKVKQVASEAGEAASAGLDQAGDKVGEAVDAVKHAGSEVAGSVVDTSKSLTDPADGDAASEEKVSEAQVQIGAASGDRAAVAGSGQDTVDQASVDATDTVQKTVETTGSAAVGVKESFDPGQIASGRKIYSKSCMACHSAGVAGAPKISDAGAWTARIAQGMDTLNDHAINGFKGNSGFMPAKGGFGALSDDEVKAAVAYMVSFVSQ